MFILDEFLDAYATREEKKQQQQEATTANTNKEADSLVMHTQHSSTPSDSDVTKNIAYSNNTNNSSHPRVIPSASSSSPGPSISSKKMTTTSPMHMPPPMPVMSSPSAPSSVATALAKHIPVSSLASPPGSVLSGGVMTKEQSVLKNNKSIDAELEKSSIISEALMDKLSKENFYGQKSNNSMSMSTLDSGSLLSSVVESTGRNNDISNILSNIIVPVAADNIPDAKKVLDTLDTQQQQQQQQQ